MKVVVLVAIASVSKAEGDGFDTYEGDTHHLLLMVTVLFLKIIFKMLWALKGQKKKLL